MGNQVPKLDQVESVWINVTVESVVTHGHDHNAYQALRDYFKWFLDTQDCVRLGLSLGV